MSNHDLCECGEPRLFGEVCCVDCLDMDDRCSSSCCSPAACNEPDRDDIERDIAERHARQGRI